MEPIDYGERSLLKPSHTCIGYIKMCCAITEGVVPCFRSWCNDTRFALKESPETLRLRLVTGLKLNHLNLSTSAVQFRKGLNGGMDGN